MADSTRDVSGRAATRARAQNSPEKGPTTPSWNKQKDKIRYLYINQALPLKEVARVMERDHNFKASLRMYKARLDKWGYSKNVQHRDWQAAALQLHSRNMEGKRTVAFEINGKRRTVKELMTFIIIKCKEDTLESFVEKAQSVNPLLSTVRCLSPEDLHQRTPSFEDPQAQVSHSSETSASFLDTPPSSKKSKTSQQTSANMPLELGYGNMGSIAAPNRALAYQTSPQVQVMPTSLSPPTPTLQSSKGPAYTYSMDLSALLRESEGQAYTECECDQIQQDLGLMAAQLRKPQEVQRSFPKLKDLYSWVLMGLPDPSDGSRLCPKCHMPLRAHTPMTSASLNGDPADLPQRMSQQPLGPQIPLRPGDDNITAFFTWCQAACMFWGQKKLELVLKSMRQAEVLFEKMLVENNDSALLSVLTTLSLLHAYDQGDLSSSIVRALWRVAIGILGEGNALTLCIEWLASAAGTEIRHCRIKIAALEVICSTVEQNFGPRHENTIVAQYCLAFHLAFEKRYAEAETKYTHLVDICQKKLGTGDLLTIICQNGLGRQQSRLGKQDAAIETIVKSLENQPLGPNHPFRLETKKRLAVLYKKAGQMDLADKQYWEVLEGRLKTLGKSHQYTEDSRLQLERFLKNEGRWDESGLTENRIRMMFEEGNTSTDVEVWS